MGEGMHGCRLADRGRRSGPATRHAYVREHEARNCGHELVRLAGLDPCARLRDTRAAAAPGAERTGLSPLAASGRGPTASAFGRGTVAARGAASARRAGARRTVGLHAAVWVDLAAVRRRIRVRPIRWVRRAARVRLLSVVRLGMGRNSLGVGPRSVAVLRGPRPRALRLVRPWLVEDAVVLALQAGTGARRCCVSRDTAFAHETPGAAAAGAPGAKVIPRARSARAEFRPRRTTMIPGPIRNVKVSVSDGIALGLEPLAPVSAAC